MTSELSSNNVSIVAIDMFLIRSNFPLGSYIIRIVAQNIQIVMFTPLFPDCGHHNNRGGYLLMTRFLLTISRVYHRQNQRCRDESLIHSYETSCRAAPLHDAPS